ncbi:MAG: GTPase/DUF3482 domain-containing protein [Symploca sp. SIO2B6]|nr:GTPase/DUF3482 domain-containing protein [Symploca sp. SIO2B6]
MNLTTINIAVSGHTNTGKTTLIRTFMRTSIGEVGDSPNVTKKGEAYFYDGLQATFIDTPGFQQASAVAIYLDLQQENPDLKMPSAWESKVIYDRDAMNSIEASQVVLYVGDLNVVPDDSHKEELNIIKKIQPKVVGILNQYRKQSEVSDKEAINHRINLWKELFEAEGIEFVVFDAHWDNPVKINKIYDSIHKILEPEHQDLFSEGLEKFKNRQAEIRKESCSMLAECIKDIQEYEGVSFKKSLYRNEEQQEEAKNKITRELYDKSVGFMARVSALYQIAAEFPTSPKDEIKYKMKQLPNFSARVSVGSSTATMLGSGGAILGASIGAGITMILTGGLGIEAEVLSGALLGVQIGGVIGGFIGSFGVFLDDDDIIKIKLEPEEIEAIVTKGLAVIWGLSNNGYGRGRDLSTEEIKNLEDKIRLLQSKKPQINWLNETQINIANYCDEILESMENNE